MILRKMSKSKQMLGNLAYCPAGVMLCVIDDSQGTVTEYKELKTPKTLLVTKDDKDLIMVYYDSREWWVKKRDIMVVK